jgi:hypothetical protein
MGQGSGAGFRMSRVGEPAIGCAAVTIGTGLGKARFTNRAAAGKD